MSRANASVESASLHFLSEERVRGISPLDLKLQCPRCGTSLAGLQCRICALDLSPVKGITPALPPERAAYYARFATEYERIRAAEGRGSQSEAFYLALPDKDLNGHNSGQWRIRAASFRCLKQHVLKNSADRCAVLDLGAGNCWMSFRLGQIGYQTVAVDLLVNENDGLGAAKHYERYLTTPIRCFQAEATHLPFCSAQFDYVLFNASFHYAEDYEETLRESLRCLKVGGKIVIIDTPWYSREQSGKQMLAERQATFKRRFGTASDAVRSLEFLTDERLAHLAKRLDLAWEQHSPDYGWKWAIRPWIAKLRGRREPSRFRIYVATKRA